MDVIVPILTLIGIVLALVEKTKKESANRPRPGRSGQPAGAAPAKPLGAGAARQAVEGRVREWMQALTDEDAAPSSEGRPSAEGAKPGARKDAGVKAPPPEPSIHAAQPDMQRSGAQPSTPGASAPQPVRPATGAAAAGTACRFTPAQMREAVVMSEILNKPVSMRGRKRLY